MTKKISGGPDISQGDHDAFLHRSRFDGLDGIRCVAILAVIWHHAPHANLLPMFGRGFLGVDLFFVLSGFLISTLLLREKRDFGRISLGDFWMRRVLRLVPAYYLLLFGLLGAYLVLKPGAPETENFLHGFPAYALYLSNWVDPNVAMLGPTWSLATEEQFYLVWPLFEAFASPISAGAAIAAGLFVNQLINFGVLDGTIAQLSGWTPDDHPEILETTFTPILLGVLLAHLLHRPLTFDLAKKLAGWKHAAGAYAALLLIVLNIPVSDISGALRFSIHVTATLLIAAIILNPHGAVARLLEWGPIAHVGKVSYGVYLYHLFGLLAASAVTRKFGLGDTPATFFLGAAVTVAVATASYQYLEKPFLRRRSKFRRRTPA